MFKKSFVFAAVVAAFSATSLAAEVSIYGIIDSGIAVRHKAPSNGASKDTSVEMATGIMMGNRFGFRGKEQITDSLAVSFVLEGGYEGDTGNLFSYGGDRSRIFGRESQVSVHTPYGTLSFGRVGNLMSGNGTYGIWANNASPFGIGFLESGSQYTMQGYSRLDNAVTYKTPDFAGLTAIAQYSFANNGQENPDESVVRHSIIPSKRHSA